MPRLEGQRSNTGLYIIVVLVVLIVAFLLLEYFGAIDLISGFGS